MAKLQERNVLIGLTVLGVLLGELVFLVSLWNWLPSADTAKQSSILWFLIDPLIWMFGIPIGILHGVIGYIIAVRFPRQFMVGSALFVLIFTVVVVAFVTRSLGYVGLLVSFPSIFLSARIAWLFASWRSVTSRREG
jgi:hypothetical protein